MAVNALYKSAEIYYTTNKPDKAIPVFSKLIQDFPNDTLAVNAHYYIAACYESLNKTEEAVSAYKAFLKNYPKNDLSGDVTFRLATADYTSKNYTEAIFYYERVLEKFPGTEYEPNAMYNAAIAYADLNKMDDAIRYYRMFAAKFPKDEKSKTIPSQIAGIYLDQKRYGDAVSAYLDIFKNGDDLAKEEALYRIGDIYNKQENETQAIQYYTQLIDMKPKESDFRMAGLINLATVYQDQQDWKNSVRIYRIIAESNGKKEYTDGAKQMITQITAAYPDLFKTPGAAKDKDEGGTKEKKKEK
jgi:TolA-binding protein